ncbi:hypothetical protein ACHHYP_08136 [Achlya hypogyna]|uniref:JmjC domain-containing protein n=1 Tax=Achlya hypogyna TaxID=1202772 RepID=A0A1V9ZL82_ACHHY|nr:hypothetical protein ACHHYP_08136 [Achlya hypogyna]
MFEARLPALVPVAALTAGDEDSTAFLTSSEGFLGHRDTIVDVACAPPSEAAYSGDVRLRQSVELKFGDFVAYYSAKCSGGTHWLMETEDELQFYLAQCPLLSTQPSTPAVLPGLAPLFPPPAAIAKVPMTQVNLWMTLAASATTLHYDAYDNILRVVRGTKYVRLFTPTSAVAAHPVYSKSANHSLLQMADIEAREPTYSFTVTPNNALFIPEGWWHQVSSEPFTIAVNYWFDGLRPALVMHPHMQPYYARVLVEDLITQARKAHKVAFVKAAASLMRTEKHLPFPDSSVAGIASYIARQGTAAATLLCLVPNDSVHPVCLALSAYHPEFWKSLLLEGASPDAIEYLTESWDDHDRIVATTGVESASAFFSQLYEPFSELEEAALQDHLLATKEAFAKSVARQVLHDALGWQT